MRQRSEFVRIDDLQTYKRVRVQLHAQGIVQRDTVAGAEIKTKSQQPCRAGDFLVAEIDAKVGGFGIVPDNLAGAIVSSHYFLFELDGDALDGRFLDYFIRTPAFQEQVKAQGSTNYAAVRPAEVLQYEIPLPPLAEQRRIVARIEQLAAKIQEARGLRQMAGGQAEAYLSACSAAALSNSNWESRTMDSLVGRQNLKNGISIKSSDCATGIRCLKLSSMRDGRIDCSQCKPIPMTKPQAEPFLVHEGEVFVVRGNGSKDLMGRAGIVEERCEGVVFPDLFIRVPLNQNIIVAPFFVAAWNSRGTRAVIEEKAKTTSGIWKINQGHIASISIPVPPPPDQRRIVTYLDNLQAKVEVLKRLQAETAAELDALMPSILDRAFKGKL